MSLIENRLGEASSLYLRQHRDNPVAWQPWNEEVLALAKQQDKPILLSIGYSACHWCHVMAHESFEDPEIAEMMNRMFINIKVDREERPDIDYVYQTAHQLLTGRSGGWPLTVFVCPRTHLPFLVGTYFPKRANGGQLSFPDLLLKVNDYYHARGKDFLETLDEVKHSYKVLAEKESRLDVELQLDLQPCGQAVLSLLRTADSVAGGFGGAPKFPMPNNLERLWVAGINPNRWQQQALHHLEFTLLSMAKAGINDQVGGGFFRYATDQNWMIPHFEKMLYDNGQLLSVYAESYRIIKNPLIENTARSIIQWALDEMCSEEGVFYSSIDADSENQEGVYYLWSPDELNQLLTQEESAFVHAFFELDKYPNFDGRWHLHRERDLEEVLQELEIDQERAQVLLESAREKMLAARRQRAAPGIDKKIVTSWNALMLRGLAIASRAFNEKQYLQVAQRAIDFVRNRLFINGRLFATWQDGQAIISGYLDDYVFLMDALLELLRTHWRDEDYQLLTSLAESVLEHFEDRENGGFYFTADDAEELIYRSKPAFDNVMPSGNGVAAKVFSRFGHLSAEPRYLECVQRTLLNHWPSIFKQPQGHHNLLIALQEHLTAPAQVLIKGDESLEDWRQTIYQNFGESVICYRVPLDSDLHPTEMFVLDDNQALLCVGDHCMEPQSTLDGLLQQLQSHFNE